AADVESTRRATTSDTNPAGLKGKGLILSLRLPACLGPHQQVKLPAVVLMLERGEAEAEPDPLGLVDDVPPERDPAGRQQQFELHQLARLDEVFRQDERPGGAEVCDRGYVAGTPALPAA